MTEVTINVAGAPVAGETKAPEAKAPEPIKQEPVNLDAPAVEPKPAEGGGAGDKPPLNDVEADDGEKKEKLSGSERQKRKAQRLAAELADRDRVIEELKRAQTGEPKKDGKPGVDREPAEADFPNDYFAFERARTAWDVRQAIREERQAEVGSREKAQRAEARMELVDEYQEAAERVKERITDFDAVMKKSTAPISDELAEEILSAGEKGPLISYYLAQNPDKLSSLNQLSGKALAREVGRIESRVHLPKAKTATEASPPPTIPKGGAAPAFDPFKSDDMDAYAKWRKAGGGKKYA